jgi:hypothetical protein
MVIGSALFLCCSHTVEETHSVQVIDFESAIDVGRYAVQNLSDYASSIRYLPIETTDDALLGRIATSIYPIYYNGMFYIVSDEKVYKFDSTGKFVTKIGNKGEGPEEYLGINGLDINPDNNHLYLLGGIYEKGLLEFDLEGRFIRKLSLKTNQLIEEFPSNFKVLSSDLYLFDLATTRDADYRLAFSDSLFQNLSLIPYSEPQKGIGVHYVNNFQRLKETVYYYAKMHDDTIYTVLPNRTIEPSYILKQGKYKYSKEKKNSSTSIFNSGYVDTGSYIFMNWVFNDYSPETFEYERTYGTTKRTVTNTNVYSVYDKKRNELHLLKQPVPKVLGLKNDLNDGSAFWPQFISSDATEMFMYYDSAAFIESFQGKQNLPDDVKKILKDLKEDDNPVIAIAKLKNEND